MTKKRLTSILFLAVVAASPFLMKAALDAPSPIGVDARVSSVATQPIRPSMEPAEASETYKIWQQMVGEQYDRNYVGNMIAHHEGTIEMAQLALTKASSQAIKAWASEALVMQPAERTSYLLWQRQWGYPSTSGIDMQDHTAMGMLNANALKKEELMKLTGEAFDARFAELMIEHQQEAIEMSKPGKTNAQHQEIKNLTEALAISMQEQIAQMKRWQKS